VISPVTLAQFERLKERFPDAKHQLLESGAVLFELPKVTLPAGWSQAETPLWFLAPVGYPGPCPDCFWVRQDLRLQNGAMPNASQVQTIPETSQMALWFSWHVADQQKNWNPSRDTLSTYVSITLDRLRKVQ
jgi:hypothetical protein